MTAIGGTTRLVGLIGWPVAHSKSPLMQNAALAAAGIDAAYVPLPVAPEQVGDAVIGLRALGFRGVNVTIPHKMAVLPFLDSLTPEAEVVGAVNTIRVEGDGSLTGHNTDCLGAVRAVEQDGTPVAGRHVVVLGAGGAGRGVAAGVALAGAAAVTVLNRTVDKAQRLVEELGGRLRPLGVSPRWSAGSPDGSTIDWSTVDIVMQMTSIGMEDNPGVPVDPSLLHPEIHLLEAVYAPAETDFLRACRAKGLRTSDGLSMLLEQGAAAFEFWFDIPPDRDVMRAALSTG